MNDNYAEELGRFDDDYAADPGQRPKLDVLVNGDYEFEIVHASIDRTPNSGDLILRLHHRVLSGASAQGLVVEQPHFLKNQNGINRLGAFLSALGFDSDKWTGQHGKRFSVELLKTVPRLKGVKFRARKMAEAGSDGKTYQNLYVAGRVYGTTPAGTTANGSAPTAASYTPPPPPKPRQQAAPTQQASAQIPEDDDIPFSFIPFIPFIGTVLAMGGFLA